MGDRDRPEGIVRQEELIAVSNLWRGPQSLFKRASNIYTKRLILRILGNSIGVPRRP